MARLALTRRRRLDGFVEGLFDGADEIDLPEKANASLGVLAEMRAVTGGAHDLAMRTVDPADPARIQETLRRRGGSGNLNKGYEWIVRATSA